jgi:hypothetical protein
MRARLWGEPEQSPMLAMYFPSAYRYIRARHGEAQPTADRAIAFLGLLSKRGVSGRQKIECRYGCRLRHGWLLRQQQNSQPRVAACAELQDHRRGPAQRLLRGWHAAVVDCARFGDCLLGFPWAPNSFMSWLSARPTRLQPADGCRCKGKSAQSQTPTHRKRKRRGRQGICACPEPYGLQGGRGGGVRPATRAANHLVPLPRGGIEKNEIGRNFLHLQQLARIPAID